MDLKDAQKLKAGDIVFNFFKEKVVIDSIFLQDDTIRIGCITTDLQVEYYTHSMIYTDLDHISDEENSFLDWCIEHKERIIENINNFDIMKNCFKIGYVCGFFSSYRKTNNVVV
jgi:hypothetical protein